jgi:diamine N-acetyltransferase
MIEGSLIRLRFPEPGDHLKLVKWRNENLQYFFSDEPVSMENHLDWYERVCHDASQRFFVIERKEEPAEFIEAGNCGTYVPHDALPVGTIGLQNIDFRHRCAEYGRFLVAEEYRGKGYGKDALATLLRFAFDTLGLHKVYGEILTRNSEALELCKSLGFLQSGIMPDHVFKQSQFWDVTRVAILAAEFDAESRK